MKNSILKILSLFFFLQISFTAVKSQNVAINATGNLPDASAMLDVQSPNKGLLIPQVSLLSINDAVTILNPAPSLLIYNTNAALSGGKGFYYNSGTNLLPVWSKLGIASTDWKLAGNAGTTPGTDFIGTTDARDFVTKTNNLERLRVLSNGNTGIGVTAPTATLHLKAGSTAAGTAPLKLSDGPLLTTPEPGAIEYKGHSFFATTYFVRRSVMLAQDVVVNPVIVTNTGAETVIYSVAMAADYLERGKMINTKLFGRFFTNGASDIYTIRVKLSGVTILTVTSVSQNANNRPFDIDIRSIVRSIGAAGTIISYGKTQQDNQTPNIEMGNLTNINTTLSNTITITVQWNNTNINNIFTLEGGATECVDANN